MGFRGASLAIMVLVEDGTKPAEFLSCLVGLSNS